MTSTRPSLGRLYTPSLAEDSGDGDPVTDSLRKDSMDLNPISLSSKDMGSVHQLLTRIDCPSGAHDFCPIDKFHRWGSVGEFDCEV